MIPLRTGPRHEGDGRQRAHAAAIMALARAFLTLCYLDLVPYLERLCLRPFTPLASSVPRTMW
jgi:hypothetical protein